MKDSVNKNDMSYIRLHDSRLNLDTRQEKAREIMAKGLFWGIEEWSKYLRCEFTEAQRKMVERVPGSSIQLEYARHTYFLHVGFCPCITSDNKPVKSLTVSNWLNLKKQLEKAKRENGGDESDEERILRKRLRWINIPDLLKENKAICTQSLGLKWYLTRIMPRPRRDIKSFLCDLDLIPSVIEAIQMLIFYEVLNGNRPDLNGFIQTRDVVDRSIISVGYSSKLKKYIEFGEDIIDPLSISVETPENKKDKKNKIIDNGISLELPEED